MTFQAYALTDREVAIDIRTSPVGRIYVRRWGPASGFNVPEGGGAIVLPTQRTTVAWDVYAADIGIGCYAQVPGGAVCIGGAGLVIYTPEYCGLTQFGGPVEPHGRLRYIDGCSDSLLICPARRGDPCLNLLHLPAGTEQTAHTHPSERIGIILRGKGLCRTAAGTVELGPGMFWHIPTEFVHSFHTQDVALDVLAWHPDSDFGPSHDEHPMVNRTIVDGTPATDPRHAGIRTREAK